MLFSGGEQFRLRWKALLNAETAEIVDDDSSDPVCLPGQYCQFGYSGLGHLAARGGAAGKMRVEKYHGFARTALGKHLRQQRDGIAVIDLHVGIFGKMFRSLPGKLGIKLYCQDCREGARAAGRHDASEGAGFDQILGAHPPAERADGQIFHQAVLIGGNAAPEPEKIYEISNQSRRPAVWRIHAFLL